MVDDKKRAWLENIIKLKQKKEEELKELENQKKKEIREAEEILKASIEELQEEEIHILETLKKQDIIKNKEEFLQTLEETIAKEKITPSEKGLNYQDQIEQLLATPTAVYERSDLYANLKNTLEKIEKGQYLTQKEQEQIHNMQKELENNIVQEDKFGYIERSKTVINEIETAMKTSSLYKTGDDH